MARNRNRRRQSPRREASASLSRGEGGEGGVGGGGGGGIVDLIGDDLLQNILSRLPASSFASAACVSRSWNAICNRVLSFPKLSSALSLNSSQQDAVNEVLDKVLSEPIRPHFAIVSVCPFFSLSQTHKLITKKLGSQTPVVTSVSYGVMGSDALTDEFKEVKWETEDEEENLSISECNGILLTVGYLPGLKVVAVPLLQPDEEPRVAMVDDFVMQIREQIALLSGSKSPAGIIMFGDLETDMKPVLNKMDYALSMETVIVGDGGSRFLYNGGICRNANTDQHCTCVAVAILFARDRGNLHGIGETQFHITLSTGLSPVGPTFKAACVKEKHDECSTWLTARREGLRENLDGQTILDQIYEEIGARIQDPVFYLGVTKRRKYSIGLDKVRWLTSWDFHEVQGGDEEYLFVSDVGIRTGDSFRFYCSDSEAAAASSKTINDYFRCLKQDNNAKNQNHAANNINKGVFGCLMFSCCGRGESFLGSRNIDSSNFSENFPGIPLAGTFCAGEIGRCNSSVYLRESCQEQSSVSCSMHVFSTVYLVMAYAPGLSED